MQEWLEAAKTRLDEVLELDVEFQGVHLEFRLVSDGRLWSALAPVTEHPPKVSEILDCDPMEEAIDVVL
jgi:hypothetical protein